MDEQAPGNSHAISATPPGRGLIGLLERAAGPGERYPGLTDGGTVVAAGRWDAAESWCAARKLAAIRELIRRNPQPGHEADAAGELPGAWRKDLIEQVALELAITRNAADALIVLAWTLEKRLPLTAAALEAGILNLSKARMIVDETSVLSDEDARAAEALAAGMWQDRTWSQIRDRIARAVVEVDPRGAEKRRERSEREDARVRFWREQTGTAAIAGYGLPTDQALKAIANVQNRARAYKRHGIKEPMDFLRVMAMLDLLNGADARTRYPKASPGGREDRGVDDHDHGEPEPGHDDKPEDDQLEDGDPEDGDPENGGPEDERPEDDGPGDGAPEDERPEDGGPGGGGPGDGGRGNGGPAGNGGAGDGLAANLALTVPLATLLGLAERPGEAHGLGVLDPALARKLAAEAADNPRSGIDLIITDQHGRAIGFGHGTKGRKPRADMPPPPHQAPGSHSGSPATADFAAAGTGPPGGYGTWTLATGNQTLTFALAPIPQGDCDHRFESKGYQPSGTLRRLVEIRDGQCTMPVCVRHPRTCDWEHAIPWPQGPTCACNGGARCRRDHRTKQTRGWKLQQFPGGLHQWTTPAGLTYTKGPRQYPI
ncbi:MAG: DUF222 domain-containing protein [Streptosporangiaceae bacterium]|nr:DUF222 domain-containing protein [Streptosporangiaceae bacterium]